MKYQAVPGHGISRGFRWYLVENRIAVVVQRRKIICEGQQGDVTLSVTRFCYPGYSETISGRVVVVVVICETLLGSSACSQKIVINILKESCVECYERFNEQRKY